MHDKQIRLIALCGIVLCLLAVAIGAFGAHAFKELLISNQRQDVFDLANRYQFYHGLGLMLIAALFGRTESPPKLGLIGSLMLLGTLVFSGSLYMLSLLNLSWLGAVTPIGGVMLISAWGLLAKRSLRFNE